MSISQQQGSGPQDVDQYKAGPDTHASLIQQILRKSLLYIEWFLQSP
jgi:hypothetical protein